MAPYRLTREQTKEREQAFIDAIDEDAVCRLASVHNGGQPCRVFQKADNGSFNVCYFVEFGGGAGDNAEADVAAGEVTRWVVRFPIVPAVFDPWEKIRGEVATIRYLQANTTIPVPHVHAFGPAGLPDACNPTGLAYMIVDYVEGESLDLEVYAKANPKDRERFLLQLVDFMAELYEQEFSQAGSLTLDDKGAPVLGPLHSMQLNEFQVVVRDMDDKSIKAPTPALFSSAIDFAFHQFELIRQDYSLPESGLLLVDAQRQVVALDGAFSKIAASIDLAENHGPFVLAHTDLRWSNIIVDKTDPCLIRGIIDWEFTSSIPRQFFVPPFWLAARHVNSVIETTYEISYTLLHLSLFQRELGSKKKNPLYKAWPSRFCRTARWAVAFLLRHHGDFFVLYYMGVILPLCRKTAKDNTSRFELIAAYIERYLALEGGDGLQVAVQNMMQTSKEYELYLKENGLFIETVDEGKPPDDKDAKQVSKDEASKNEASKGDASTGDASTGDASTGDASTGDASTDNASTDEASTSKASTDEASTSEASTSEASKDEVSKDEASTGEASKQEASNDEDKV